MKLATSRQMRELEQAAVAAGTSLDELMEQAGLAVAQEAWLALGVPAGRRVVVLVGPGNNGGDGLVAARHLAQWEANVVVYMVSARDDERVAALRQSGVPTLVASEDDGFKTLTSVLHDAELIIDALLGTGRSRKIEGELAAILQPLRDAQESSRPPKVVAVDLPTGVDADTGSADELAVRADTTVALGVAKVGLYSRPGSDYAGRIEVVDIGLPQASVAQLPIELLDITSARGRLPARPKDGNKGTFGRVLVVAGSSQYVGAPRLAAEACYRAGAGLVTIATTERVQRTVASALAEVTWFELPEEDGMLSAGAAPAVTARLSDYDVLAIGPGLGGGSGVAHVVQDVLRNLPPNLRGCVVDADALNLLAAGSSPWHEAVQAPCVLTPHPGEMARLLGTRVAEVQRDRLNTAIDAARSWRQVVVLKGAHTVVAAPDGRAAVSPYANPLLASAGTGDVLAGMIAGLLAQGCAAFEAAAGAVFVHGLAAEELSEQFGDRGLLASDLLPAIPRAMRLVLNGPPPGSKMQGLGDLAALFSNRPGG